MPRPNLLGREPASGAGLAKQTHHCQGVPQVSSLRPGIPRTQMHVQADAPPLPCRVESPTRRVAQVSGSKLSTTKGCPRSREANSPPPRGAPGLAFETWDTDHIHQPLWAGGSEPRASRDLPKEPAETRPSFSPVKSPPSPKSPPNPTQLLPLPSLTLSQINPPSLPIKSPKSLALKMKGGFSMTLKTIPVPTVCHEPKHTGEGSPGRPKKRLRERRK